MTTAHPAPPTGSTKSALPPGTLPVVILLVASAFIVILNETIMSVALPRLMVEFQISASTAQWLTTGFLLTMAVVIPLTGYILARFPVRSVFLAAMSLFALGTLISGLAPGFEVLLAGRIIQASGTAVMMPLLMTTVMNLVTPEHRGRMMGVISIVISVAPAIGPTVSGVILANLEWRWMFLIVLPLVILALILGAIWVRNVTETRRVKFDPLSVILSGFGFGLLVFGLSSIGAAASGEATFPVWVPIVAGVLGLIAFSGRQLSLAKTDSALLDLRAFRSKSFSLAVTLIVVVAAALFGSLILLPLFLQQVLGLDTLTTGLMMLPGGVLMGLIAPVVGSLFDRFGPTPLVIPGMVVAAGALWGMTTFDQGTDIWWVVTVHLALNLGLGFVFTPLMTSALGSLPRKLYPHGSAIVGTIQQVAGAAGTAVFISIMTIQSTKLIGQGTDAIAATASGIHSAFLVGAIIATFAIVLAAFVRPAPAPDEDEIAPSIEASERSAA